MTGSAGRADMAEAFTWRRWWLGRRGRHGEGRRQQENPSKFTYEEQMGNRRRYTHVTPAKRP